MNLTGTIKLINNEEIISDKFKKRSFVIVTEDTKHPQEIFLELHQDKTGLIDMYAEGQKVTVSININGRCWTNPENVDKYFNTIVVWKIEN